MSSKKPKATRKRMISCFAQIVQEHIPGWKIEEIASGEKVKARKFSYSSQVYLLMLSQFLHLFSLNEIVDVSKIYAAELSRVRGITPANLNTFSNANRTRDPKVMQTFFWTMYDIFRNEEPDFIKRNSSRRSSSRTSTARTKTRSRNAPAPKVSGRVSEANCEAASRPRADMGRAPDPSRPAVAQVQVGCGVQLLALRRTRQGHRLAEEGRDGDHALLWDSTTPRLRRHSIGNAVFAGFREDVPEVCGIAERRFAGRWRRESSHATENGIS